MRRSKHSLSHTRLLSLDMGQLIPIGVVEVLPGDTVQHATTALVRASPLLSPVMHPVDVRIHHWFVPYRILWPIGTDDTEDDEGFETFITGGREGTDAQDPPWIDIGDALNVTGCLADYMGLPQITTGTVRVSALPFRAYTMIWNEFYRDRDLQNAAAIGDGNGQDTTTSAFTVKNVCWEKDYYTSSRPTASKGTTITLPLGTTAPVTGIGILDGNTASATDRVVWETDAGATTTYSDTWGTASNDVILKAESAAVPGTTNTPQIYADLSNASAVTINALREALALQRYQEARSQYGSRYVEYLRYLGVRSSDARLQRPEYLGGGRETIQFSEVLQTGVTTSGATAGVGSLRGHGLASMRSNRYRRFFEEHGVVLSLMSVRPKTMYMQGISKKWNRQSKEDYWQKELETIGQAEVLNQEVYAAHASPTGVMGYQDRYDEYRREESGVSGEFKTSTLNFWHLAREFGSDPALNSDFVECIPTERVFAVNTTDVLWVMCKHSIQARRLVSQVARSMTF